MATIARAASEPIERAGSKGFCIATRCADVGEFIAKFQASCDETSMFVATSGTRAIGHASPFIILLADKTPVMRGTCTVLEAWTDGDNPFGRPGIRIALDQLTDSSRDIFEQLLAARAGSELRKKSPEQRSATMIGFPIVRVPADARPQPVTDGPTERMAQPPAAVVELGLARPLPRLPPSPIQIKVEGSGGVRQPKGMRIATSCRSADEFVDTFHPCCEPSSIFIATRTIRPIGVDTAFSIDLADGRPMLRGRCTVLEAWPTGANRFRRPGVLIGVTQLTPDSRELFDRLLAAGKRAEVPEAKPVVVRDRLTRPMVALGIPAERFAVPMIKPVTKPRADETLPLSARSLSRLAVATPPAPAPVAPEPVAATPVEAEAPADAEAAVEPEAAMLPRPPAPEEIEPAPEAAADAVPVETEIPIALPEPPLPLVIVAPQYSAPVEPPVAPPAVIAKRSPRWLALAVTFAAGIALGAVAGFTARPALAPTTTVVAVPTPVAISPVAVAAPPAPPPAAPHAAAPPAARTPAPAVHAAAVVPAAKRRPVKRVARPTKHASVCADLSCL